MGGPMPSLILVRRILLRQPDAFQSASFCDRGGRGM